MAIFLLFLILVVLAFIATGLNPRFGNFLKSILNLSAGVGALLFLLAIVGGILWGGYYFFTRNPDNLEAMFYLFILFALIYFAVIFPLTKGQRFLEKKGLKISSKVWGAITIVVGVVFVVLLGLLLNHFGL